MPKLDIAKLPADSRTAFRGRRKDGKPYSK
jgi:hypothetical protein